MPSYMLKITAFSLILCINSELHSAAQNGFKHPPIPSLAHLCVKKIMEHNIPYEQHTFEHLAVHNEAKKLDTWRRRLISGIDYAFHTNLYWIDRVTAEGAYAGLVSLDRPWNRGESCLQRCCRLSKIKTVVTNGASLVEILNVPIGVCIFVTLPCGFWYPPYFLCPASIVACSLTGASLLRSYILNHRSDLLNHYCCSAQWKSDLEPPRCMTMEEDDNEEEHAKIE